MKSIKKKLKRAILAAKSSGETMERVEAYSVYVNTKCNHRQTKFQTS